MGPRGTEKCWKPGLMERLRESENAVCTAGYPCNPFQRKYLPGTGDALIFFSRRYACMCGPDFQDLGACERINCRESWGLWAEFHQKQFLSFLTKIGAKFELLYLQIALFSENCFLEAIFYIYLSNEDLVNGRKPQRGVLWTAGEAWKSDLNGRTSPYAFSG